MNIERFKEVLNYDMETGIFTWRIRMGKRAPEGGVAGCTVTTKGKSYRYIKINGKRYFAHRIAYSMVTGEIPDQVDHKDGNGINNKWENLRSSCYSDNNKNKRRPSNNTSGHIGVSWHVVHKKWCSRIKVNQKQIYLGIFDDINDAIKARKDAEAKYGFYASHGSDRPL